MLNNITFFRLNKPLNAHCLIKCNHCWMRHKSGVKHHEYDVQMADNPTGGVLAILWISGGAEEASQLCRAKACGLICVYFSLQKDKRLEDDRFVTRVCGGSKRMRKVWLREGEKASNLPLTHWGYPANERNRCNSCRWGRLSAAGYLTWIRWKWKWLEVNGRNTDKLVVEGPVEERKFYFSVTS